MTAELLRLYEHEIKSIELIPSDNGKFEVVINNQLIYSKHQTNRHAKPGEVADLVNQLIQER